MSKREFWLYSRGHGYNPETYTRKLDSKIQDIGLKNDDGFRYYVPHTNIWTKFQEEIHVIEYSAYQDLEKKLEKGAV